MNYKQKPIMQWTQADVADAIRDGAYNDGGTAIATRAYRESKIRINKPVETYTYLANRARFLGHIIGRVRPRTFDRLFPELVRVQTKLLRLRDASLSSAA